MTYSCETEKTGRCKDGNICVYIIQNKLSKWNINNEAVNVCQALANKPQFMSEEWGLTSTLTHTYRRKWQLSFEGRTFFCFSTLFVFFSCFPSFFSKACRCVAMRKKTGSSPPALVSMERHARKTKTSELYKHHSRKTAARTTH